MYVRLCQSWPSLILVKVFGLFFEFAFAGMYRIETVEEESTAAHGDLKDIGGNAPIKSYCSCGELFRPGERACGNCTAPNEYNYERSLASPDDFYSLNSR
jgi:hypothetical protein